MSRVHYKREDAMAQLGFRIKTNDDAQSTLVRVELVGAIENATIPQFEQVMENLLEKGIKKLELECGNLTFINSAGLGILLKYADLFTSVDGHISLHHVQEKVMLVVELLGFHNLLDIQKG